MHTTSSTVPGSLSAFAGIDVGKESLDLAILLADGKVLRHHLANYQADHTRIVALCQTYQVTLVVLEATGGLELNVASALAASGIPVSVITPAQSKAFAGALNRKAKTDALDAELLASFARHMPPELTQIPSENLRALRELAARRRQLIEQLVAEKNHLGQARHPKVKKSILQVLSLLEKQLASMDDQLGELICADEKLQLAVERMDSIPGVGKATATALVIACPELGTLNRQQIASLAGLAPYDHQSGQTNSPRHIRGGRAGMRSALYMATLTAIRRNPAIKAFYRHLVQSGKLKMVALTAAMRKLLIIINSMVRDGKTWTEFMPQYA
jgi:transposase